MPLVSGNQGNRIETLGGCAFCDSDPTPGILGCGQVRAERNAAPVAA